MKLGLFLIAGAIVNVAVAWGCAFWEPGLIEELSSLRRFEVDREHWIVISRFRHRCRITTYYDASRGEAFLEGARGGGMAPSNVEFADLPPWCFARHIEWDGIDTQKRVVQDRAAGWPIFSVHCRLIGTGAPEQVSLSGGLRLPAEELAGPLGPVYRHRILPCIPIWPGFAINTVFYAAILWLLFAAPFKVRRWRRIRRGLCPACAYPVGASETCTECGRVIPLPLGEGRVRA